MNPEGVIRVLGPMVIAMLLPMAVIGVFCLVRRDPPRCARFARWVALVTAVLVGLLVGLFLAGEALTEPGGLRGALLVACWMVPLAVLTVVAWRAPPSAPVVLGICAGAAAMLTLSEPLLAEQWRAWENSVGPVLGVVSFILLVPLGVMGVRRPALAGALLLGLAALGLMVESIGMLGSGAPLAAAAGGSSAALALPLAVVGILLLVAAGLGRIGSRDRTPPSPGPHDAPGPALERLDSPQDSPSEAPR